MPPVDFFLIFTRPLDEAGAPYMVSGSVASMVYGEPRLTNDIDLVITIDADLAARMEQVFPSDLFYCPPADIIALESRRPHRGHFNIIHHGTGMKADVYLTGSDSLQAWGLARRKSIEIADGRSLWLAPIEYVILKKLEYYREGHSEKHLHDIRGMLAVSGNTVDREFLGSQLDRMKLQEEWLQASQIA